MNYWDIPYRDALKANNVANQTFRETEEIQDLDNLLLETIKHELRFMITRIFDTKVIGYWCCVCGADECILYKPPNILYQFDEWWKLQLLKRGIDPTTISAKSKVAR